MLDDLFIADEIGYGIGWDEFDSYGSADFGYSDFDWGDTWGEPGPAMTLEPPDFMGDWMNAPGDVFGSGTFDLPGWNDFNPGSSGDWITDHYGPPDIGGGGMLEPPDFMGDWMNKPADVFKTGTLPAPGPWGIQFPQSSSGGSFWDRVKDFASGLKMTASPGTPTSGGASRPGGSQQWPFPGAPGGSGVPLLVWLAVGGGLVWFLTRKRAEA